MLNSQDEAFLAYWAENREKQKSSIRPFIIGLSGGLILGISILISMESGWDIRASMVANTRLSSVVFIMAILIISVFMAFLYRKFRWEMQEQRYLELFFQKKKEENKEIKQP